MIIVLVIILFLLLRGGGALNISAAAAPVIHNATGGSLSQALGQNNAGPSFYSTGNPNTAAKVVTALPQPRVSSGPVYAGTSATRSPVPVSTNGQPPSVNRAIVSGFLTRTPSPILARGPVRIAPPNVPVRTSLNPTGAFNPTVAQRPIVITRNSPEVASPFWTPSNPKLIAPVVGRTRTTL